MGGPATSFGTARARDWPSISEAVTVRTMSQAQAAMARLPTGMFLIRDQLPRPLIDSSGMRLNPSEPFEHSHGTTTPASHLWV